MKERFVEFIHDLQNQICTALEQEDGSKRFTEDQWERPGGGGGKSRVLEKGAVFEKAGVNTSIVYGEMPESLKQKMNTEGHRFFACGISLVIHPQNPFVPTTHANFRYFEMYDTNGNLLDQWFGGGSDLTPYYLFEEDATHFHQIQKEAADKHGIDLYPRFKKDCDNYFWNHHRNEARGIGGTFFDYLKANDQKSIEEWFAFTTEMGRSFIPSYLPIVQRRKGLKYSEENRYWQELRRGRYVEFNLVHDRGTLFGLKTNGRIESILMSLPPRVRWDYNKQPEKGSDEARVIEVLQQPKEWIK